MPPLAVFRSSCKDIEYFENQNTWRHAPKRSMDDNTEHVDDEVDEDLLGQAEEVWASINCGFKVLGYSRERCEVKGMQPFCCTECGNAVADHDDVVSKTFYGRTGKAFLLNNMYNVRVGYAGNRNLITGMHFIADILCRKCDFVLGWKYVSERCSNLIIEIFTLSLRTKLKAMESSQKYKEGKFILEHALVQDESEELAWKRSRAF